jgi:hypothetical protein
MVPSRPTRLHTTASSRYVGLRGRRSRTPSHVQEASRYTPTIARMPLEVRYETALEVELESDFVRGPVILELRRTVRLPEGSLKPRPPTTQPLMRIRRRRATWARSAKTTNAKPKRSRRRTRWSTAGRQGLACRCMRWPSVLRSTF